MADVTIAAVVVIANLTNEEAKSKGVGTAMVEEKYNTRVYSVITTKDIENVIHRMNQIYEDLWEEWQKQIPE